MDQRTGREENRSIYEIRYRLDSTKGAFGEFLLHHGSTYYEVIMGWREFKNYVARLRRAGVSVSEVVRRPLVTFEFVSKAVWKPPEAGEV